MPSPSQNTTSTSTSIDINDLIERSLSNPQDLILTLITLGIGIGMGYVVAKMIKYAIAFIVLFIIGSALSLWRANISIQDLAEKYGPTLNQIRELLTTIGILSFGPLGLGFLIGLLIGLLR